MKAHPRPISRVAQRTLAHYATATHCQQPVQDEKPTYKRKKKMIKKENYTFTPVDSQMFHFDLYILNSYSTNLKKISLWTLTHETSESVKFLDPPPPTPEKKKKKLLSKILEINLKDV
jgi:hypothetical protein